jgi:hypothetical protein
MFKLTIRNTPAPVFKTIEDWMRDSDTRSGDCFVNGYNDNEAIMLVRSSCDADRFAIVMLQSVQDSLPIMGLSASVYTGTYRRVKATLTLDCQ